MSVLRGDCVEVMAGMEPDSVDAIVTDPPYDLTNRVPDVGRCQSCGRVLGGADGSPSRCPRCGGALGSNRGGFMGQRWDGTGVAFRPETWAAALRVAKPGAYLLAFGGTRTVHRMTCALEDAGWVVRDMLMWVYLQGFPKSKASLKPAYEPIILARKPGASRDLNIDACRLPTTENLNGGAYVGSGERHDGTDAWRFRNGGRSALPGDSRTDAGQGMYAPGSTTGREYVQPEGRWPANVVMTEDVFGGGVEGVVGGGWQSGGGTPKRRIAPPGNGQTLGGGWTEGYETGKEPTDTEGSKSRIFIIPKAPTSERVLSDGRRSPHPTQKPEALIRHLVTLVTPPGGLVLDPFLGSGTLGVVCEGLGVRWVGIEREAEYADWAEDRIADGRPQWMAAG